MSAPEGWRLVPIEPTQEMLDACMGNEYGGLITREYRTAFYRRMVEAAPESGNTLSQPETDQINAIAKEIYGTLATEQEIRFAIAVLAASALRELK
jgi:hypothetical protein